MRSIFTNLIILIGFLFSWSVAFGQSKFAFSATVAPFYGHSVNKAMVPIDDGSGNYTYQEWKSEVSPKGYWIGLNGRYSFSHKWSASTGLWFGHSSLKTSNSSSRSHFFTIPVIANFQTSEKKLSPYFSAGGLWNFGTTSRVNIPDIGTVIFKSDHNTLRISPMVGAGIIYHFAQRLSLIAQPTFSYSIPPSGVNTRAYQLSLNLQLMLKL